MHVDAGERLTSLLIEHAASDLHGAIHSECDFGNGLSCFHHDRGNSLWEIVVLTSEEAIQARPRYGQSKGSRRIRANCLRRLVNPADLDIRFGDSANADFEDF